MPSKKDKIFILSLYGEEEFEIDKTDTQREGLNIEKTHIWLSHQNINSQNLSINLNSYS